MITINENELKSYDELQKIVKYFEDKGVVVAIMDSQEYYDYITECWTTYSGMTCMILKNKWVCCIGPAILEPNALWNDACKIGDIETDAISFSLAFFDFSDMETAMKIDRTVTTIEAVAEELWKYSFPNVAQ